MRKKTAPALQEKLWAVYDEIRHRFYRVRDDLDVGGVRLNSTLALTILGFVTRSNVALFGPPGSGKTTVIELVGSILAGVPFPGLVASMIRGTPEVTEEKLVGRLHLGKLQRGEEAVIWSSFVRSLVHIVDELNRVPAIKQALILEGVRTGKWVYMGSVLNSDKAPLFATLNFEERGGGTFEIVPALRDRFAIGIEVGYPGVATAMEIALADTEDAILTSGLADRADEAVAILNAPDYERAGLVAFCEQFKNHLAGKGFTTLSAAELDQARREIEAMPLYAPDEAPSRMDAKADREATLLSRTGTFVAFLVSSLNFCVHTGAKRSDQFGEEGRGECRDDCRFKKAPCGVLEGGGSRRLERDCVMTAKALAWLLGERHVKPEHVVAVAPYCLWHRRPFSQQYLKLVEGSRRTRCVALEAAIRWVNETYAAFAELEGLIKEVRTEIANGRAFDAPFALSNQTGVRLHELPPFLQDLVRSAEGWLRIRR